jgi:hypothetical protein
MSCLENELRKALRRQDPPEGFVERTLAKAAMAQRHKQIGFFSGRMLRWAMVGAACLALTFVTLEHRQKEIERTQGEAAKEQLIFALRVAGSTLQFAQSKIQQR